MQEEQGITLADQNFFPSRKSSLWGMRISLWLGLPIAILFSVTRPDSTLSSILFSNGVVLLTLFLIDHYLIKKRLQTSRALATLSREAIESPNFSGRQKRFLWSDIESVALASTQGAPYLTFHIKESATIKDKRSFWTGINPARPALLLSPLAPADQENLLDAINLRLQLASGNPAQAPTIPNQLAAERVFKAELQALAPHPWATYTLIAVNLIVWLATLEWGAGFAQAPADKLLAWGGNAASEVQRGEWWRLVTATFLHSGFLHIAMNMIGLYGAGVTLERIYGARLLILIYLGSGLCGSALSLHFSAQQAVSVGASGAVFGITGALLMAIWQHRDKLPKTFSAQTMGEIGFFVLYSLVQGFTKEGIDNAAHVGGLLGGCLLAFILPERFDLQHFRKTLKTRTVLALMAISMITLVLASTAPKATIDQSRIFAGAKLLEQGLKHFDQAFKSLQQEQEDLRSGKITERQVDDRSRTIHAPAFKQVITELSQVVLRPGDPRESLLKDIIRMSELLAEGLAMESVFDAEGKPHPVDAERSMQIESEMIKVGERFKNHLAALKKTP